MTGISPQATRPEPALWRGMSRAQLDVAYDNTNAVAESSSLLAEWTRRSEKMRADHPQLLDLAYGPRERNRIDIFRCGRDEAPLFVFIHGGYWQRNSRSVFSCMAEGLLSHGIDVALPGYTLAPNASLGEIVDEVQAAIRWLRREGPALGVATGRLVVSGWSAGGHLAAVAMAMPEVDAGLAISGIYDLEPIRLGVLNDKVGLTTEDVAALSPLSNIPARAGNLAVAYGTSELPELQRQSRAFAEAWQARGLPGTLVSVGNANHFTILEELRQPGGELAQQARILSG